MEPHVCDICGHEVSGYSRAALLKIGWRWHDAKRGRMIVVCGECRNRSKPKRKPRSQLARK